MGLMKGRRKNLISALLQGTVLTAGFVAPALAQESGGRLDEIVVTAQKREQGSNDVGITLNAFTGDQLQARGVQTAEDLALITPGLTVNDTAATGVPLYTIRGVGFQDYSTAASSTVGLYFDEVAIPYTVMSRGALFDIQRVEVLKGPQGDLYGRNTTAGQINFISNKPTDELDAGASFGYSSFDTVDVNLHLSGPISDGVRGRLAFTTTQSGEGWQESLTRDDELGKQNVFSVRGMLEFDLGSNADLLLRAQYVKDKSDNKANTAYDGRIIGSTEFALPYAQIFPFIGTGLAPWYSTGDNRAADWTNSYTDPNGVTYNLRPRRDNDLISLSAKLNWNLTEDVALTAISGFDKFEREEANDWDGSFANDSSNINTSDIEVFSQEVRLTGEGEKLNWVAGLYYSDDNVNEFYNYFMSDSLFGNGGVVFGAQPFASSPILQLHTRYDQDTTSKAAFAHAEYNITPRFRFTGGVRYTDEKRTWTGCTFDAGEGTLSGFLNFAFGSTLAPGDCGTIDDDPASPTYVFGLLGGPNANDAFHVYNETIRAKKWMYKAGVDYKLTDDVLAYAMYSHGFKSGGFNGANSNTTQQLRGYKPEELDSYEAGLKSTLANGSMQLNLSGFYYDYKNKQEQDLAVTFVGNISGLTNVPKSRIFGAEADIQWAPTDGLFLNFGAAWLDTKVLEWQAVSPTSVWPTVVTFDASGIELAQSPHWQLNGGFEYEWGLSEGLKMRLGADGNYKGDTSGSARGDTYATESYAVFNARVSVGDDDDKWALTFWSRNLFDEYYFPSAYQGGNGPWIRSVGMPRTFGATFDVKF
ncbi:MAG: TonB-dependent receptor [Alphaproteobacteria bacterium RIFCSPHIGHO2_12_FULL_63_12]|nr:MAG: TonB-dependent receptor [Alphaproteobacteria bacterium RIFCSPHIGHO2_12_FULL_63_12]